MTLTLSDGIYVGTAVPSGGGDVVTATNNTGSAINAGDKVWIDKNGQNYEIEDFYKTLSRNYDIVGEVKILANGATSAFSGTNYLTLKAPESVSKFESVIKFKTGGSDISTFQNIYDLAPLIELYIENGKLCIYSESEQSYVYCGSVNFSQVYYAKVSIDNGVATLSFSTDGSTYTGTVTISNTDTDITHKKIGMGYYTSRYFRGNIFMDESYFKFDNMVLGNYSSEAITGVSKENIASGSTGTVETVLPE